MPTAPPGRAGSAYRHAAAERRAPHGRDHHADRPPQGHPRFSCNGKPVKAVAVFYNLKAGYTGDDNAVIDVDFKTGQVRRFSYKITVR